MAIGQFNGVQFFSGQFNTGSASPVVVTTAAEEVMGPPDRETIRKLELYKQVMREDEEILTILLNAVTSGILEN